MTRLGYYALPLPAIRGEQETFDVTVQSQRVFRPARALTNVEGTGVVAIEQLYIGGRPQLVLDEPVDAYMWSAVLAAKLIREFMTEIGAKTLEDVDRICDEREISPPDPGRISLETVEQGESVRLTGRFLLGAASGFLFAFVLGGPTPNGR